MKKKRKIILLLIIIVGLFGCSIGGTPKSKVEALLKKYQDNDSSVTTELDDYLNTLTISSDYLAEYKKVYLKQYQDLSYKITDETIKDNKATVTAEIKVYDYYGTENKVKSYIAANPTEFEDNGVYSPNKALKYKLDELNNTKDKVTYTVTFTLTKTDNTWSVDPLTDEILEKIHGNYAH